MNYHFPYLTIVILLSAAAIIDIRKKRIPDKLVLAGTVAGLAFVLIDPQREFLSSILGGATAGLVLLLIHYITKGGLGLGDVKLFGCSGIFLGFESTVSAMLISAVLSGLFSMVLICLNPDNKKSEIPFAPFILAGVLAVIIP
ncbi:MAG: prepilin peptidase [Clostridia bacterium]|jgi:Flp pilus assembly protein protease CpaA|nr:prepilin peptidase [Clostridia bacterium]HOH89566.1 A24 family peptidase [Bacillota bacterium]HOM44123.1 A24 family peptidase [Bacillota bacterium]